MTVSDKLTAVAENSARLYAAGVAAEHAAFWDSFLKNGTRTDYQYAFYTSQWNDTTFRPRYDLRPVNADNMFSSSAISDMKGILDRYGVTLDTSCATNLRQAFYWCRSLKEVPVIDATAVTDKTNGLYAIFGGDDKLVSIDALILPSDGSLKLTNSFMNCVALKELRIGGVIGQNIDLQASILLSHESLMSVLTALADRTGDAGTYVCTLGTDNLAKLTAAERQIATDKGWVLK